MQKAFLILLCFFGFSLNTAFAQPKTETIEMDLYFRYLDLFRYFDVKPKELNKLEHFITSVNLKKATEDSLYVVLFRQAMKNNLIHMPFIYVKADTSDFNLFLSKTDYNKFSGYNYDSLELEHKKVRIKADVKEIEYFGQKAYRCVNLISIQKTEGTSFNDKTHSYHVNYYDPINDTIK